jgi:hypothetical protein
MMVTPSKIPWPGTYLDRLQAVMAELRKIGGPASLDFLVERFSGVTAEQIEATLTALILFGRVHKEAEGFSALEEG